MCVQRSDYYHHLAVLNGALAAWEDGHCKEALSSLEDLWDRLRVSQDAMSRTCLLPRVRAFLEQAQRC